MQQSKSMNQTINEDRSRRRSSPTVLGGPYRRKLLTTAFVLAFIGTEVLATPGGVKLSSTRRHRPRELKYIFADPKQEHDEDNVSTKPSRGYSQPRNVPYSVPSSQTRTTRTSPSSSRLHEISKAFKQVVVPEKKQDNVHVGKLLNAMSKMENHMRNVGMKQQANELKGNYDKVMRLYSAAPEEKRDSVRELLQWELETGIHGDIENRDPILKVKNSSGAMGLFWLGHTVKYQYNLYRLMMEEGMSPVEAATIAFQKDVEPHLPWAASRVAKSMIPRLTPPTQLEFFSKLGGYDGSSYGPEEHQGMTQDIKSMMGAMDNILGEWSSPFAELQLSDI